MSLVNQNGNNDSATATDPTDDKQCPTVFCTYCAEMAVGYNAAGQATCDIPHNHPNWDTVVVKEI